MTPLMTASRNGHLDVVILLIKNGANVHHTHKVSIFVCILMLFVLYNLCYLKYTTKNNSLVKII